MLVIAHFSFFAIKISLEALNAATEQINRFVCSDKICQASIQERNAVSLSSEQLEAAVAVATAAGDATITALKPVLLALVQTKRMDVGCERGSKVYKVKLISTEHV